MDLSLESILESIAIDCLSHAPSGGPHGTLVQKKYDW